MNYIKYPSIEVGNGTRHTLKRVPEMQECRLANSISGPIVLSSLYAPRLNKNLLSELFFII